MLLRPLLSRCHVDDGIDAKEQVAQLSVVLDDSRFVQWVDNFRYCCYSFDSVMDLVKDAVHSCLHTMEQGR